MKYKRFDSLIGIICLYLVSTLGVAQSLDAAQNPGYEAKARSLGIEFNTAAKPNDHFVPAVTTGNLVFLSVTVPENQKGEPSRARWVGI